MLAAQCRLDRRQAIISIGVHQFDPSQSAASIPMNQYRALIDTGATRTCLTYRAIGNEGLVKTGKKLVKNVHNENLHGLYMASIGIFTSHRYDQGRARPESSYFGLGEPVELMDIADNERFDAILGMDVLGKFDFKFLKGGEFILELP